MRALSVGLYKAQSTKVALGQQEFTYGLAAGLSIFYEE
jgi:hypothetical protein